MLCLPLHGRQHSQVQAILFCHGRHTYLGMARHEVAEASVGANAHHLIHLLPNPRGRHHEEPCAVRGSHMRNAGVHLSAHALHPRNAKFIGVEQSLTFVEVHHTLAEHENEEVRLPSHRRHAVAPRHAVGLRHDVQIFPLAVEHPLVSVAAPLLLFADHSPLLASHAAKQLHLKFVGIPREGHQLVDALVLRELLCEEVCSYEHCLGGDSVAPRGGGHPPRGAVEALEGRRPQGRPDQALEERMAPLVLAAALRLAEGAHHEVLAHSADVHLAHDAVTAAVTPPLLVSLPEVFGVKNDVA
mmetsp:Transcript_7949/g.33447  ORF Transcript_7949/g.33447 Transcript_7949/m.33447 type:complete len:300 (-) Transcript_7949:2034-2933(-)